MKNSRLLAISMAVCTASSGRDPLLIRPRRERLEYVFAWLMLVLGVAVLIIVFVFR